MREDDSPAAAERRRIAREAILERARQALENRRQQRGGSFDELVDNEGKLRKQEETADNDTTTSGATSGVDLYNASPQLRNRGVAGAAGMVEGAAAGAMSDPFGDDMVASFNSGLSEDEAFERARRESASNSATLDEDLEAALTASVASFQSASEKHSSSQLSKSTAADGSANNGQRAALSEVSDSDSEVLLDLTPTTSRAPSTFHAVATPRTRSPGTLSAERSPAALTPRTPRSAVSGAYDTLMDEDDIPTLLQDAVQASRSITGLDNFQSIHEWAESSTASIHSPPRSESGQGLNFEDMLMQALQASAVESRAATETAGAASITGNASDARTASVAQSSDGMAVGAMKQQEHAPLHSQQQTSPSRSRSRTLSLSFEREYHAAEAAAAAVAAGSASPAEHRDGVRSISSLSFRTEDEDHGQDLSGLSTPSAWTDVGSAISEGH